MFIHSETYTSLNLMPFDAHDVKGHKHRVYSISKKNPLSYRMFNATLRKKFSALLEAGAAVVVWHYFPTDWPHLDTHDERFNMRVRENADSGFTMKLVLRRETAIARTYSTRRCTESPVFPMDCDMSHVLHCHSYIEVTPTSESWIRRSNLRR